VSEGILLSDQIRLNGILFAKADNTKIFQEGLVSKLLRDQGNNRSKTSGNWAGD
jgi:hypothetical protein